MTLKRKAKKFKLGFKQIIIEVATGLLTTLVLNLLMNSGYLPDNIALIVNIILIVLNLLLIKSMWSWGAFYTLGWLIGSYIFFQLGWLESWDVVLYLYLPVLAILIRLGLAIKRLVTT